MCVADTMTFGLGEACNVFFLWMWRDGIGFVGTLGNW